MSGSIEPCDECRPELQQPDSTVMLSRFVGWLGRLVLPDDAWDWETPPDPLRSAQCGPRVCPDAPGVRRLQWVDRVSDRGPYWDPYWDSPLAAEPPPDMSGGHDWGAL